MSDDNLQLGQAQGSQKFRDTSINITPAVLVQYGVQDGQKGYASLTYSPTLVRFFHYSAQDADDQNLLFTARYPFQRLTLDAAEAYSQSSGVNQDTNTRTQQTTQVSTAGLNYEIDDKLNLTSHVQEVDTTYAQGEGQGDTTDSVNSSLSYQVSDKLRVGPSANFGQDKPKNGTGPGGNFGSGNQLKSNYEQALLGVFYQPTEKITGNAQAGMEFRQYDDNGGDQANPIFALGLGYNPFDSTNLSLNAYGNSRASSANAGQSVMTTGVGFSATQRFIQRFFLNLSVSYEHDDYQSTGNNTGTPSYTEDSWVYRPSLTFDPTLWTAVGLYYQYQDNKSDGVGVSYHDNQFGISISAQF